jgi:6-pyruvoyltetrahydropterin/6-carboxytetrahydropterin synthase
MPWTSTKTYGHNEGLSCAFRQWKATHSHCSKVHGYALSFKIEFYSQDGFLDDRNWIMDFGGLKDLKAFLHDTFDHKTVVAEDDPYLEEFRYLHGRGIIDLVEMAQVGCEKFAEFVWQKASEITSVATKGRVLVRSVECREHEGNSAIYRLPEVHRAGPPIDLLRFK